MTPFAVSQPCFFVGTCAPPADVSILRSVPWKKRRLLFFAGRVPKRRISSLRGSLYFALRNNSDAALHLTFVNPSEQPPDFNQSLLSYGEYVKFAMSSRFCVVASGDNLATPKFTEAILVASQGGCIPFVFCSIRTCQWPWHERLPLHKVAVFSSLRTLKADLAFIEGMDELEAKRRHQAAVHFSPHYRSVLDGRWSAAHTTIREMCNEALHPRTPAMTMQKPLSLIRGGGLCAHPSKVHVDHAGQSKKKCIF